MIACAVWWPPSSTISHVTPGAISRIGSLEPYTRSWSSTCSSRVITWPNSGRGANETRTGTEPDSIRNSDVSESSPSNQSHTVSPDQRLEADVNVEFQSNSKMAAESQKLAWYFSTANEKYATDYPAAVGPHMTNTDSGRFQDLVASVSLRENERGAQIGSGWDPQWHQPTDLFATYSDQDFRLGLNAAQTTLGAVAQLTGATLKAVSR